MYIKLLIILSLIAYCNLKKCHVLALEGGGDKGAYQAGALKGLVEYASETGWDVVTGISVGSLNAAGISIFPIGSEAEATEYLLTKWRTIEGKNDIYKNWFLGPLYGLFYKTGIYDTSPLKKLLTDIINGKTLKRKIIIGTTNVETGNYERFDEETLMHDEYSTALMTSAAFPVIFPNIDFRNNTYMDGGVKISVDIAAGINKCMEDGFAQNEIVVDVVLCNSKVLPTRDPSNFHPMEVLIRYLEINGYDKAMSDVDQVVDIFKNVNFRYIIGPTKKLPSGLIPLTFSKSEIETMINMGIDDAKKVVEMGQGKNFEKLRIEYRMKEIQRLGINLK